jgi:protein-tyrosine-phosphatase
MTKVFFICTGNLCRSPMAEGMMRHALEERGCSDVEVSSAGTWAYDGSPATPEAVETVGRDGVDLSNHRSRPIAMDELLEADVVVAMTSVHVRELASLAPEVVDRIVLMKELREIDPLPVPRDARLDEKLDALMRGKRPPRRRSLDVDDPMGLPINAYDRCARELREGIDVLVETICG